MSERINKLQPDRTVYLRGFDSFAAAASIHDASPGGFTVSGTFRDPADFAVAVLYDADNYYEHPLIKYLPDFNLAGLTLSFNLQYTDGVQPIDSPKYNWIDWATLDCIRADGTTSQVRLWDNAMLAGADFPAATATLSVLASGVIQAYERVTLWFQNIAFDYIAPDGKASVEFQFYAAGNGKVHSVTIDGTTYSHTENSLTGESSATVAAALRAAISSPLVMVTGGSTSNAILLTVAPAMAGFAFPASASDGNAAVTMLLTTPAIVAANLAGQINSTNWRAANSTFALIASSSGAQIVITAARYGTVNVNGTSVASVSGSRFAGIIAGSAILIGGAGYTVASIQSPTQLTLTSAAPVATGASYVAARGGRDGNMIQLYATAAGSTLTFDQSQIQLTGGSSTVTWTCTLDFTALGIDQLRQCWLTFAPSLINSAYTSTEWEAVFSNWQLTGPATTQALSVAGPGSVRIEETGSECVFKGVWSVEEGFYSKYFAKATSDMTALVTVTYNCQCTHDLYIGTSLYIDRAVVGVSLDNDTQTSLDCRLTTGSAVVTRRVVRHSVAPGRHTVAITMQQAGVFYFDFLEAAVPSDVPDALVPRTNISPALDFDTDHTYQLTPARLMWILDQLGYAGPMNEYLGVFWWNERVLAGGSLSSALVTFTGPFATGDALFLNLNGTVLGKTILDGAVDTPAVIARHFADYINGAFVGAWAATNGSALTITGGSPAPAYTVSLAMRTTSVAGTLGVTTQAAQIGFSGSFAAGDTIVLTLNGTALTMTAAAGQAPSDIAAWFQTSLGTGFAATVTASAAGSLLTLVSGTPFLLAVWTGSATGQAAIGQAGQYGSWIINDAANPPINRAVRDWHADFYRQCASRSREVVTSCSMELVNPPAGYVAQFPDTSPVSTATGFAGLVSSQCAAGSSKLLAYQKAVYRSIAQMQAAAGLTPCIQYGEFLWWYFAGPGGMGYYDAETMAAAQAALGRPLHVFATPNDDPAVNGGADSLFLRNRLRDHVAALAADIRSAYPAVICEVLFPYDVNYPTPVPAGNPSVGGQLNRLVNLPVEWQLKTTSGLDRMKVEALSFGSSIRSLDLVRQAVNLFPGFGWPLDSLKYLLPVFGAATPWNRELAIARGAGITTNNLWALDHVCLFNLTVPEPPLERRSTVKTS